MKSKTVVIFSLKYIADSLSLLDQQSFPLLLTASSKYSCDFLTINTSQREHLMIALQMFIKIECILL